MCVNNNDNKSKAVSNNKGQTDISGSYKNYLDTEILQHPYLVVYIGMNARAAALKLNTKPCTA